MAGTDTSRGMNFQYASALRLLLEFPEHPDWSVIQFEGDEHIEDAIIMNREGYIVLRAQFKQKIDPHRWEPNEWNSVIEAFAQTPNSDNALFQFIFAGALGPAAVELDQIFLEIRHNPSSQLENEGAELLNKYLSPRSKQFVFEVGNRLGFSKRDTWQSMKDHDLRRLRRLLVHHSQNHPPEDIEEDIYNKLFVEIAHKTEPPSKYFRQLTRMEIYGLLGITEMQGSQTVFNVAAYRAWISDQIRRIAPIVPTDLLREDTAPEILTLVVQPEYKFNRTLTNTPASSSNEQLSLLDALNLYRRIVVVGTPGSGKTSALLQLTKHYIDVGTDSSGQSTSPKMLPIYINLAGYDGESIDSLLQDAFQSAGQISTAESIKTLIAEKDLLLLLDDFDAARASQLPNLILHLRKWFASHPLSWAVIVSHRAADGYSLKLDTFRLLPLTSEQRKTILLNLGGIDAGDATVICNGLPAESDYLLNSPLTLRMLAYVYLNSGRRVPQSQAKLYEEVVDGMVALSEQKGFKGVLRSDKVAALSMLAAWMQDAETYSLSPARLGSLLVEWINDHSSRYNLVALSGYAVNDLRQELLQSGLLQLSLDESVSFVHSTFMSYFAAQILDARSAREVFGKHNWHVSLIFLASLADQKQMEQLLDEFDGQPALLGRFIKERVTKREVVSRNEEQMKDYFESFSRSYFELLKHFPLLLKMPPWSALRENRAQLTICQAAASGYIVICREMASSSNIVEWIREDRIRAMAQENAAASPLPMWLLPKAVVEKYHPLELAYFWVIRSLFDLVEFSGFIGGVNFDKDKLDPHSITLHPAVKLITQQFTLLQLVTAELPADIRAEMPFYAQKEFDLFIEVDETLNPPCVRYVVRPGGNPGTIGLIPNIFKASDQRPPMIARINDTDWSLNYANTVEIVFGVEELPLPEVLTESPDNWLKQQLKDRFQELLPGFPPQRW